jgi:hypothetical protein
MDEKMTDETESQKFKRKHNTAVAINMSDDDVVMVDFQVELSFDNSTPHNFRVVDLATRRIALARRTQIE